MATKADLHVHSLFSEHPAEWFLQRIGAAESYSSPETIYKKAKSSGMDFVTITDHNKIEGALLLKENHPDDTFIGVESTAYFPEDGCKIHILCYDFSEKQFAELQKFRKNIYDFREYLLEQRIIHSVAHLNYSINGKLKLSHIEKLILMFDVFEGINGSRSKIANRAIIDVLENLNSDIIEILNKKHKIDLLTETPWIKGITAGSNDHSALFIGRSYTESSVNNLPDFLASIAEKKTNPFGRSNDFTSLVFTTYKVAWDYSKARSNKFTKSIFSDISAMIFESKPLGLVQKLKLKGYNITIGEDNIMAKKVIELIQKLDDSNDIHSEKRFEMIYHTLNIIIDRIIQDIINYFLKNTKELNLQEAITKISSVLPAVFLGLPFITTFNMLFKDRKLIRKMRKQFNVKEDKAGRRILWFTDTILDLNGVSATLQELAWNAYNNNKNITLACTFDKDENRKLLPPRILEFDNIFSFKAPYYDKINFKIPSFLSSLEKIYSAEPDEIFISTPGFVGLIGLLASKLLHIPSTGIFHSDFKAQLDKMTDDNSTGELVGSFVYWFYNNVDTIAVPSVEYKDILESYGFVDKKIKLFPRWINTSLFKPDNNAREIINEKLGIKSGFTLLYTGRVSKEKNLDFIVEIHKHIKITYPDINTIIVGDGPYLAEIKENCKSVENIYFPGRIDRYQLAKYYPSADIFLFPSETDTFGMSVLEAQSCGVPCLVSDIGGPKEIIIDGKSGFALPVNNINDWIDTIIKLLKMKNENIDNYQSICKEARKNVKKRFSLSNYEPGNLVDI